MSTDIEKVNRAAPAPAPGRIGQATAIEQSRAVAEVQAAIIVAQQCPRDMQIALAQMRQSCEQMGLAERAFYRVPRGGSTVNGPSVHLARELARCFGNLQYGVGEMRRDDDHGQSEMLAFAWDVQTNTRASTTFIVPHLRDKRGGAERLTDSQDIYQNNANNGARRVREAIFSLLPTWFVEEAKALCNKTLNEGGGVPLEARISKALDSFAARGVSRDQLETRLGRATGKWTAHDIATLTIVYGSIVAGEVTVEDEFPQERVTAAEITGQTEAAAKAGAKARAPKAKEDPAPAAPDDEPEPPADWVPGAPLQDPPAGGPS